MGTVSLEEAVFEASDLRLADLFSKAIIPQVAHIIGWFIIGLGFAGLFALVFGLVVKWLWHMLMPAVFGLSEITFWQAFGVVILAKLLFGGFSPRRYDRSH